MSKPIFNNTPNPVYKIDGKEIWASRSVAVVGSLIASYRHELYVLAEKRSEKMDHPNMWCLPCGYLDYDENGWDALRREVYEETSFLIDDFEEYIKDNNKKEPYYIVTDVLENRQNVVLNYCIHFNFEKGLPLEVESYSDSEISQIKWVPIKKIFEYDWAFNHNSTIINALKRLNII